MSISHSVIESVFKNFILLSVFVKKMSWWNPPLLFLRLWVWSKQEFNEIIYRKFIQCHRRLTHLLFFCIRFFYLLFILFQSNLHIHNSIFDLSKLTKLFRWDSMLLWRLRLDWGCSCQNFPRATKVWSWHTNNQTSNALTYETLGRFLSDTDDWLMLKYFTNLIAHHTRFTHLRLANIPMQIRAGAFVGSIQKLKIDHHF